MAEVSGRSGSARTPGRPSPSSPGAARRFATPGSASSPSSASIHVRYARRNRRRRARSSRGSCTRSPRDRRRRRCRRRGSCADRSRRDEAAARRACCRNREPSVLDEAAQRALLVQHAIAGCLRNRIRRRISPARAFAPVDDLVDERRRLGDTSTAALLVVDVVLVGAALDGVERLAPCEDGRGARLAFFRELRPGPTRVRPARDLDGGARSGG